MGHRTESTQPDPAERDAGSRVTREGAGDPAATFFGEALDIASAAVGGRVAEDFTGHLWHYTDGRSAEGILRTGHMWATDADYLNDTTELRTLSNALWAVAQERDRARSTRSTRHLVGVLTFMRSFLRTVYVVSFSTLDNDLSQWRAYGDDGGGYAFVFDAGALADLRAVGVPDDNIPLLTRCEYLTRDELRARAEALADRAVEALEGGGPDGIELCQMILQIGMELSGPVHKSTAYRGEAEYRLVLFAQPRRTDVDTVDPAPGRNARLRGDQFVPYVRIDVGPALESVWIGPRHQRDAARYGYGLRAYLDSVGRGSLRVFASNEPYRG